LRSGSGSFLTSVGIFEKALRLHPNDFSILMSLGDGYDRVGQHAEAVQVFRHAVQLQPQDAERWVSLAGILKRTENKEAIKALQQAERLKPSSGQIWSEIGMLYQLLNRYSNAQKPHFKNP
jgi:cytochrome c-type biogenesis protein CcmH/NrfG